MEQQIKYFLVGLLFLSIPLNAQDNIESRLWSENQELQWLDFKGEPQDNYDAVAITASGITFGYSVTRSKNQIEEANFTIESHFYPDHSWYKNGKVNQVVLDHERFHFNITELFARKFRKRISETNFTLNIKEEADAIYKKINEELKVMQNTYDTETNYSMNEEAQKTWQLKIQKELNALSNYKLDI